MEFFNQKPVENSNKTHSQCVICHQSIELSNFGDGQVILEKKYVGCPNGHLVHRDCLKEWIIRSNKCPVCSEQYNLQIIKIYEDYITQHELDKKLKEEQKKKLDVEQKNAKREELNPEFEEKFERAEKLASEKNFNGAINLYWDILDKNIFNNDGDSRKLKIILHLSLAYYKEGKYTQAIRQLMKLVNIDYDYPLAFYFLGLTYEQIGLFDKVKWAYARAKKNIIKLAQTNSSYEKYLIDVNKRLKNYN